MLVLSNIWLSNMLALSCPMVEQHGSAVLPYLPIVLHYCFNCWLVMLLCKRQLQLVFTSQILCLLELLISMACS